MHISGETFRYLYRVGVLLSLVLASVTIATATAHANETVPDRGALNSADEDFKRNVEFLNELSSRRRVTTLFKNQQSRRFGVQESFVNTSKGNMTFVVRDLVRRDRMPVVLARVYDSSKVEYDDFGPGWMLGLNEFMTIHNGVATYTDSTNTTQVLTIQNDLLLPTEPGLSNVTQGLVESIDDQPSIVTLLTTGKVTKHFTRIEGVFRLTQVETSTGLIDISYDGNRISGVSSADSTISLERDKLGRIVGATDDLGREVTYLYDPKGRLVEMVGRAGDRWKYTYNDARSSELTTIEDPKGSTILAAKYSDGKVVEIRVLHAQATLEYESELTTMTTASGNRTLFHIEDGLTNGITDHRGNVTEITFDDEHKPILVERNRSPIARMDYDDDGRLRSVQTADGHTRIAYGNHGITSMSGSINKKFRYDGQGRVIESVSGKDSRKYSYDSRGFLAGVTQDDIETAFSNDSAGLVSTISKNGRHFLNYRYDSIGRISKIEYPDGKSAIFRYGNHDLRTRADYSNGLTAYMDYDETGNIIEHRLKNQKGEEEVQRYVIGDYNEVLAIHNGGSDTLPSVVFDYNQSGNISQVSWGPRRANVEYDGMNRVVEMRVDDGPVLRQKYQPMDFDSISQRDTRTGGTYVQSSSSPIFGTSDSVLYTRPLTTDFGIVNYSSELKTFVVSLEFLSPDSILKASLQRRMIPLDDRVPDSNAFGYDKPSNSAFTPPEFNSINCRICTYGIVWGSINVPAGATVESPIEILIRLRGWCYESSIESNGDESSNSSGTRSWKHSIRFGDGQSAEYETQSDSLTVSHTYYQQGSKHLSDEIFCSCYTPFAVMLLSKIFYVSGPCPQKIQVIIQEYLDKEDDLPYIPNCGQFINQIFAWSPHFKPTAYNSGTYSYLILGNMPYMAETLRAAYNEELDLNDEYGLKLTSGYRNPVKNDSLPGSVLGSFHQFGRAIDIRPAQPLPPGYKDPPKALKFLHSIAIRTFDDDYYDIEFEAGKSYIHIEYDPDGD